ncbi:MAG TPA: hypothetical protein VKY92_17575 [Verrucomicrobiae bacterium]|nr:hypothetical protein [Verrucomicrobiae bacterium]
MRVLGRASSQSFVNLDFESASVPAWGTPQTIPFAQALPGWTQTISEPLSTNVLYNNTYLDSAGICLIDTNASPFIGEVIDGRYTVLLESGLGYSTNVSDTTLSQTGLVPSGTKSIQFKAASSGKFVVSIGGQALPLAILGGGSNYTLYGADVSQWAGQTQQLSFTIFGDRPHVNDESLLLDDIQFTSQSVAVAPPFILSALESSQSVGLGATWAKVGTQNPTNLPVASGARFFRVVP